MKIAAAIIVIIIIALFVLVGGYYYYTSNISGRKIIRNEPVWIQGENSGKCWQADGLSSRSNVGTADCDEDDPNQRFVYDDDDAIRPYGDMTLSVHRQGNVDTDLESGDNIHLHSSNNINSKWKFGKNIELSGTGKYIQDRDGNLELGNNAEHTNARWNQKGRAIFG